MGINGINMNQDAKHDVVTLGSALLDLSIEVTDEELNSLGLRKGQMHLVSEEESANLKNALGERFSSITPGGSSANTAAGVVSHGGDAFFMGSIGDDEFGRTYSGETRKFGVGTALAVKPSRTGHAITLITPDSERTFATYLGAALEFTTRDIVKERIAASRILHIEGYFFELPALREVCIETMKYAKEKGVCVSVDLSDPGLIGRIKDVFTDLLPEYVSIIFANEEEALEYTGLDPEEAAVSLSKTFPVACVKVGEKGSIIRSDEKNYFIDAVKADLVNTNGAGDMYAAGVLYGISRGFDLEECGMLGSYAASLVVSCQGARLDNRIALYKERMKK